VIQNVKATRRFQRRAVIAEEVEMVEAAGVVEEAGVVDAGVEEAEDTRERDDEAGSSLRLHLQPQPDLWPAGS
jgi:hypothetical protein